MLPKYRKREYILDKLHRGFVNTCIITSAITGTMFAYFAYEYFRYIRPQHKALKLKSQEELLAEGRSLTDAASELM